MKYRHLASTLLLPTLFLFASASPSLDEGNTSLEFASEDLICHDEECYPRVFNPTNEFQTIHDDQEIPPGLHVRLNLETGVKEAKINVPLPDDATLEGVSVELEREGDIVVLSDATDEPIPSADTYKPTDPHGPIKPPPTVYDESLPFSESVNVIHTATRSPEALTSALASLEELAHEIYWGHELCTPHTVSALLDLVRTSSEPETRASAALVLGSALSNNPKALARATAEGGIVGKIVTCLQSEGNEAVRGRLMYLLNQAIKSTSSREEFLSIEGMEILLGLWDSSGDEVKGKIAVFVEDNFLNPDMRTEAQFRQQQDGALVGPEEKEGLRFCTPFQKVLVQDVNVEMGAKILSALVALKTKFGTQCNVDGAFRTWVGDMAVGEEVDGMVDGELRILAKENLALFGNS